MVTSNYRIIDLYRSLQYRLILRNCLKLHLIAITNSKFKKSTVSDMHYRIRYMHVKYQLNRDKKFVKTVNTKNKLNCKNLQLPIAIFKDRPFQTCTIVKRTCISIFSKIGLVDRSKLCTQIYL